MKGTIKNYVQPAFVLCVLVLTIGAVGMPMIQHYLKLHLVKEPIPLKKPFDELDETLLAPFKVIGKRKIDNPEILKSLGAADYLQWELLDTEAAANSAVASFEVFVTYYDKPDAVPHVPEECYAGAGFTSIGSYPITFNVEYTGDSDAKRVEIPGRYVIFGRESTNLWQPTVKFPVLYFFNANDKYINTRTEARIALAKNIRRKHSYFSKIDIIFKRGASNIEQDDAIVAAQKLLGRLLPILEQQHWPDLDDPQANDVDSDAVNDE